MMRLKRYAALLLALLILFSVFPSYAFATEGDADAVLAQTEEVQDPIQPQEADAPEMMNPPEEEAQPEEPDAESEENAPETEEKSAETAIESAEGEEKAPGEEAVHQEDAQTEQEANQEEQPQEIPVEAPSQEQTPEAEPVREETDGGDPEAIQETDELAFEAEMALAQAPQDSLTITEQQSVQLSYDDRYSFSQLKDGYGIVAIENREIRSTQVINGKNSGEKDTEVLRQKGKSDTDVIAAGIGTAVVLLAPENQVEQAKDIYQAKENTADAARENSEPLEIPCVEVTVMVTPARLSVLFLAGQSNMEGKCGNGIYPLQDSVMCPAGQVYSTFIPASGAVRRITGSKTARSILNTDVSACIPASLTGTNSIEGGKLAYPLYGLTSEGKGKTGPDGGIAYEWNRLTGDKVWTINAAWSASSIQSWVDSGECLKRAKAAYDGCVRVLNAEISAGHYTKGRRIMFWLQGEADKYMSSDTYLNYFTKLTNGFTKACGVEYYGIIAVRAANYASSYQGGDDVKMTGPRIAQYCMANSKEYSRVFLVSNANENWVSDAQVKSYFSKEYPSGVVSYPTHAEKKLTIPKTENEVHPDIHFTQIAHNENGLTAARGMYDAIYGKSAPKAVVWRNAAGKNVTAVNISSGSSAVLVPVSVPVSASKRKKYQFSSRNVSFNGNYGTVYVKKGGSHEITALDASGHRLSSLNINCLATPSGIKTQNIYGGVRVKWKAVKGAARYRVFYKTGKGSWKTAGTTSSTALDLKKGLKSGKTYAFTVRCLSADGKSYTSNYDTKGSQLTYIAAPVLKTVKAGDGIVKLTWAKSAGAAKYRVFYKQGTEGWKKAGVTSGSSFDIQGVKPGKTYSFTVRCLSEDEKHYTSSYNTKGITLTYASAPVIKTAKAGVGKVELKWRKPAGGVNYRVYYKHGNGKWQAAGDTTKTSYTVGKLKPGTYSFTVRCISKDGKSYASQYDTAGKTVTVK